MTGLAEYRWGPTSTPSIVRNLIIWTAVTTLSSALVQILFSTFEWGFGPQDYLSLSWWGLKNWYLWQFASFLFIQSLSSYGITFFYLITLFFNMYLLWVIGSQIVEFFGKKSFLKLYLIGGIFAGIFSLLMMPLTGQYSVIAGPTASILALMMVWTMMNPELEILLFFLIPIQAKWLIAGIVGAIILTTVSQGDFVSLSFYIGGILFGYFYGVTALGLKGPFPFSHPFDRFLESLESHWKKREGSERAKIYDIRTGNTILDDEKFVDTMLAKIAKHGEKSLSRAEKLRLQKISESKQKEKNSL